MNNIYLHTATLRFFHALIFTTMFGIDECFIERAIQTADDYVQILSGCGLVEAFASD